MTDAKGQYQKLPPGWDCKYDQATGNCYYINYFTKAMQLEDPRGRYKQLQNERCSTESIAMQPINGSPYHVYPSNNLQAVRAFQVGPATNTTLHNMSSSPLLSSRGNLELSPLRMQRASLTQTPRLGNMSRRSTIQETSFTNPIDTDVVVNKIQNMFPTASEDHIRLLLKKYYNREAVVISALQVEKHPVTMPGPYVTPPAQRHLYHSNTVFHLTPPAHRLDKGITARGLNGSVAVGSSSRTASPIPVGRFGSVTSVHGGVGTGGGGAGGAGGAGGYMAAAAAAAMPFHQGSPRFEQWRSSPKPHSSPKMKLRYLKTIFPKADEMVLLDILASSDNNVQTASEKLISMGYTKRDFIPPKLSHRTDHEAAHAAAAAKRAAEAIIALQPKVYTADEKATIQAHMKEKFPQLAERIILMALESVNYAEDRAIQILYIVQEEDELHAKKNAAAAAVAANAAMQTVGGHDAEVTLCAVDGVQAKVDDAGTDDSYSDAIESCQNASAKHSPFTATPFTSTTLPSSSSALLSSSLPQSSTTRSAFKSSTKINATRNIGKKVAFPSIKLTTPTTATTQIILSNSPTCIEHNAKESKTAAVVTAASVVVVDSLQNSSTIIKPSNSPSSISVAPSKALQELHISSELPSISSAASTSNLVSNEYQKLTTKSILARCNTYASGIQGYLHGTNSIKSSATGSAATTSASILDKLKLTRLREKTEPLNRVASQDSADDTSNYMQRQDFKSIIGRITTNGQSADLAKGADESLLLADYVTWNGANPDMPQGNNQKQLARGPDTSKVSERNYTPIGRNPELCKGAQTGLAKGSIYAQLAAVGNTKTTNIKCN